VEIQVELDLSGHYKDVLKAGGKIAAVNYHPTS
jgi:hypothetical protein